MSDTLDAEQARQRVLASLSERMTELAHQLRALEDEFTSMQPTFNEFIASAHPRWAGPYAHYDAEHDILHAFFEDRAAVSLWHQDGTDLQVDYHDQKRLVGVTINCFRALLAKRLKEQGK